MSHITTAEEEETRLDLAWALAGGGGGKFKPADVTLASAFEMRRIALTSAKFVLQSVRAKRVRSVGQVWFSNLHTHALLHRSHGRQVKQQTIDGQCDELKKCK